MSKRRSLLLYDQGVIDKQGRTCSREGPALGDATSEIRTLQMMSGKSSWNVQAHAILRHVMKFYESLCRLQNLEQLPQCISTQLTRRISNQTLLNIKVQACLALWTR